MDLGWLSREDGSLNTYLLPIFLCSLRRSPDDYITNTNVFYFTIKKTYVFATKHLLYIYNNIY